MKLPISSKLSGYIDYKFWIIRLKYRIICQILPIPYSNSHHTSLSTTASIYAGQLETLTIFMASLHTDSKKMGLDNIRSVCISNTFVSSLVPTNIRPDTGQYQKILCYTMCLIHSFFSFNSPIHPLLSTTKQFLHRIYPLSPPSRKRRTRSRKKQFVIGSMNMWMEDNSSTSGDFSKKKISSSWNGIPVDAFLAAKSCREQKIFIYLLGAREIFRWLYV